MHPPAIKNGPRGSSPAARTLTTLTYNFSTAVRPIVRAAVVLLTIAALAPQPARAVESQWVYPGATGRLIYAPDAQGDRLLDFSDVGYRGAGVGLIPADVPNVVTVMPAAGDDTANIHAAIAQVAAMPIGPDGFRGAVLLKAGTYDVATQININASGILLRGEGRGAGGTVLRAHRTDGNELKADAMLINIAGTGSQSFSGSTTRNMIDKVVPAGSRSFRVDSVSGFTVGDTVRVERPSTAEWIHDLGMDAIPPRDDGGTVVQWQPGTLNVRFDRVITRIEGNRIFLDAPLADSFELQYGGGTIRRYNWTGRIQNVGIENLRGESDFASSTDEDHAWNFISVDKAQNVFVREVTSAYFAKSAVESNPEAKWVTVDDAINLDPKSQVTGERRYTFDLSGQLELVTNSQANQGRHDFVNNSTRPAGPHVFHRSVANDALDESGPHQRWATGTLFDNVTVDGDQINARNRGNFGTGHGWAGANMVIWNSTAQSYIVQNPPTSQNWLIGSTGTVINDTTFGPQPAGYVDSHGTRVAVDSLYEAQLADASEIRDFHWTAPNGNWNDAAAWREGVTPGVYDVAMRDYLVGDVDSYAYDGGASVDNAFVSPAWATTIAGTSSDPITGFDDLSGNENVAFTVQHPLDAGERVIHASLALALKQSSGPADPDFVRLFDADPSHKLDFSTLGWQSQVNASGTFVGVLDLGTYRNQLQSGAVNVQVSNDTGVDWALYTATVAKPIGSASGATAFIDHGGAVAVSTVVGPIGAVYVGGDGPGMLAITAAGSLSVANSYEQAADGVLSLELGAGGEYGALEVDGTASLDGTLLLDLAAGFTPTPGAQFTLVEANSIVSPFAGAQLPPSPAETLWSLSSTAIAVTLELFWSGDFNHDRVVDAADLAVLNMSLGTTTSASHAQGDADADGDVDGADFLAWQRQRGNVSVPSSAVVPEPSAAVLALAASLCSIAVRRRRSIDLHARGNG